MDPILDLRRVRAELFTYSLRAPGQPPRLADDFYGPMEHCLHDAADALHHYFDRVELQLTGVSLGTVALAQLRCPVQRQLVLGQLQVRLSARAKPPVQGLTRGRPSEALGPLSLRAV